MHHHRQARAVARALTLAPLRRRSCGKRHYADRIAADLSLAMIRARGPARGNDPVRSYSCPSCGGWHLTSIPTWRTTAVPIPHQRAESTSAVTAG